MRNNLLRYIYAVLRRKVSADFGISTVIEDSDHSHNLRGRVHIFQASFKPGQAGGAVLVCRFANK